MARTALDPCAPVREVRRVSPTLLWFRQDLRLADNPALKAACERGAPVIPVFIWAPGEEGDWAPGGASRWWLHQSLAALDDDLRALGSRLILRSGSTQQTLETLLKETGADAVLWNRRYEPAAITRDTTIKETLRARGVTADSFNAALLHEPWTIANQSKKPFQVFTPYWRHCLTKADPSEPVPTPKELPVPSRWPKSPALEALELEPKINWAAGMRTAWRPGAAGADDNLKRFLDSAFDTYSETRNHPDVVGTSRLSPHLHFGEISPRQIWHGIRKMAEKRRMPVAAWRNSQYVTELGWREFAHHLLFHFPHTPDAPLREEFAKFKWRTESAWLKAWTKGRTGYPIVDAGMRELWTTGWMHNRVRMIVASFLVKDLLIDWRDGARWFWDTLVDADLAANTLGWQWTAGCGADAAPFFRIFNPTTQGEKFDPAGNYVRRWCPELARLPDKWIHQPDKAPSEVLRAAGVTLGLSYPHPIINHSTAREVALQVYSGIKKNAA